MLCVVGAGNMGRPLAAGLAASGHDVAIVERDIARHDRLRQHVPGVTVVDAPVACDGAILAVKPKDIGDAAVRAVSAGARRVVSIATGVTIDKIETFVGNDVPVARAMPNIGASVGKSATSVVARDRSMAEWTIDVMSAVGVAVQVEEAQLHATTALASSGPAYIFLVTEAMIDAAVAVGLSPDVARRLAVATIDGAGSLLAVSQGSPGELREQVSTPGGVTVEALRVFEDRDLRATFDDAIASAVERSRVLVENNSTK